MTGEFVGKMVSLNESMTQSEWQRNSDRHRDIVRLAHVALWVSIVSSLIALASLVVAMITLSVV